MAVTILNAWTGTNDFPTDGLSLTPSAGSNRVGLVCCSHEMNGGGGMSMGTVTWGDQTVTELHDFVVGGTSAYHNLNYVGYITEAQIAAMSGNALSFTFTNGNGGVGPFGNAKAYVGTYQDVDQANINSASNSATNTSTSSLAPGAIDVDVDEKVVAFIVNGQPNACSGGTGYTTESNFTGSSNDHASAVAHRTATTNDDTHNVAHTAAASSRMAVSNISLGVAAAGEESLPISGSVAFSGKTAVVAITAHQTVTPLLGNVVFSGKTPSPVVTDAKDAAPTLGAISFTGIAPTAAITVNQFATPSLGAISFTGLTPSPATTANQVITPSLGNITFTGLVSDPVTTAHQEVTPSLGSVVFTGLTATPTVSVGLIVNPQLGGIVFTGLTPTTEQTANHFRGPSQGSIIFTGFTPGVFSGAGRLVQPFRGRVVFTGQTPTATVTAHHVAEPSLVTVDFTGFAPTALVSIGASPSKGTVTFTGFAASVTVTNERLVYPTVGAISFTGFAPAVSGGEAVEAAAITAPGGVGRRRKPILLPDGRVTFADGPEIRKLLEFYKVSQATLEAASEELPTRTRRQRRRIKNRAIPAPEIIAELEEEEDLKFVVQEVARLLS